MSFGKALYFPFIHFQDENWLKYSLLYWDGIKRIVPPGYSLQDSSSVKLLAEAGLIENVDPKTGDKPYTQGAAEEFVPTLEDLLEKRGNLGRGAFVSESLERNAPQASVHVQKMDEKVIQLFESSGVAQCVGDWFNMNSASPAITCSVWRRT